MMKARIERVKKALAKAQERKEQQATRIKVIEIWGDRGNGPELLEVRDLCNLENIN